jgi:hypothetical protein
MKKKNQNKSQNKNRNKIQNKKLRPSFIMAFFAFFLNIGHLWAVTNWPENAAPEVALCIKEAWNRAQKKSWEQRLKTEYPYHLTAEAPRLPRFSWSLSPDWRRPQNVGNSLQLFSCSQKRCNFPSHFYSFLDPWEKKHQACLFHLCQPEVARLRRGAEDGQVPRSFHGLLQALARSERGEKWTWGELLWTVFSPVTPVKKFLFEGDPGLMIFSKVPIDPELSGLFDLGEHSTMIRKGVLYAKLQGQEGEGQRSKIFLCVSDLTLPPDFAHWQVLSPYKGLRLENRALGAMITEFVERLQRANPTSIKSGTPETHDTPEKDERRLFGNEMLRDVFQPSFFDKISERPGVQR